MWDESTQLWPVSAQHIRTVGQNVVLFTKLSPRTSMRVVFKLSCAVITFFVALITRYTVFPELRTTLRTYHPIPALQRTDGSLQDAPRIKSILKSCLLENECQDAPSTPAEIISRRVRPLYCLSGHGALTPGTP